LGFDDDFLGDDVKVGGLGNKVGDFGKKWV